MGSIKWNQMHQLNPKVSEGTIPLSMADMELKNPPEVMEGLKDFLDEMSLGYTEPNQSFIDSVVNWQKKRHNWDIQNEWIVNTEGIVAAIHAAIRAFTNKGDGIIVFRPVYYPFGEAITQNHRNEINVPLVKINGEYTIDFEAFEEAASKFKNRMLLFCSPHNPVGRVWTKEELKKIADIAAKYNLYVVSDEIWNDIILPYNEHTVLATVNKKLQETLITCTSPSKSFNLAGLRISNIIISNTKMREKFQQSIKEVGGDKINILGYKACELAYNKCEAWLDELIQLINTNQYIVHNYFKENFPYIHAPLIQGTYLQWVDFNKLNMSTKDLENFLHKDAEFFADQGYIFGEEGYGYERINLAMPTDSLKEAINRLGLALEHSLKYNK